MRIREMLIGLVNVILAISWTLLGLRFVLMLFSANPSNGFVSWIYDTSAEILAPFRGIFPTPNIDGFRLDFTALFAMMVYGLIAMLVIYIIDVITPDAEREVITEDRKTTRKR